MPGQIGLILAGLLALIAGAELLVRGASSLALRLGLTPLVVGLTVVAFGTSLPELLVSLRAALAGSGDVAAGNVVGSNIANIGLILGLAAAIHPLKVRLQLLKLDVPAAAAVTLLAIWVFSDRTVSRAEGALLFAGIVLYTAFLVRLARKETDSAVRGEFAENTPRQTKGGALLDAGLVCAGLAALSFGAGWLVGGAAGLARGLGVSEAVIGLTIVAVGTSTPELITSVVAALRKAPDIALGNVVGSNIFNILGILGATALISPFSAAGITAVDLWAMTLLLAGLVPVMLTGQTVTRAEGWVLLACYGGYLWLLWPK